MNGAKIKQFFLLQYCRKISKQYNINNNFKRIYFYHIRKTGGTSLNHSFLSSDLGMAKYIYNKLGNSPEHCVINDNKIFVGWNKYLIEKGYYFYAFSHIPAHKLNLPERTFTITIFRDPIKRVLSHYNMLLEFKKNNINHECMKEESRWLGDSFNDFLDLIPKRHLLNQLYMFSEFFDITEALQRSGDCNYIFFTEEFNKGIKGLSQQLGLKLKYFNIRKTTINYPVNKSELLKLKKLLEPEIIFYEKLQKKLKYN